METHLRSRSSATLAFARAARIYWLSIYPRLHRELRHWRTHAEVIPDQTLRALALGSQQAKIGNIEGAAAFATLVAPAHRAVAARAVTTYQIAFDYLDSVSEMASPDPIANGLQLNQALLVAVEPDAEHIDYYAHTHASDSGYLQQLVDACRTALISLPSFSAVEEAARHASARIVKYQGLNHGDTDGSHQKFDQWAKDEATRLEAHHHGEALRSWEVGAAAGSSLVIFALIAAAADPTTDRQDATAIEHAYFPWLGAANSLLDSLIDQEEDNTPGQNRLLDYYASPAEAATSLELILTEAIQHARKLAADDRHTMIAAAMFNFYLSAPPARRPELRIVHEHAQKAIGDLNTPTMLIMRARRVAARITATRISIRLIINLGDVWIGSLRKQVSAL
jgi:tetraprenyl-beta-curcumene synthase